MEFETNNAEMNDPEVDAKDHKHVNAVIKMEHEDMNDDEYEKSGASEREPNPLMADTTAAAEWYTNGAFQCEIEIKTEPESSGTTPSSLDASHWIPKELATPEQPSEPRGKNLVNVNVERVSLTNGGRKSYAEGTKTTAYENDDRSLLISGKLAENRWSEASADFSKHQLYSLEKLQRSPDRKMRHVKPNLRFIPRPLRTHDKNVRVINHNTLRQSQEQSQVVADLTVTDVDSKQLSITTLELDKQMPGSVCKSVNKSEQDKQSQELNSCASAVSEKDLHGTVKTELNQRYHEGRIPATQPSISPKGNSINPHALNIRLPRQTGHKENEDPSYDAYEEFNECDRHPNCKLTLEEVKRMADELPSCMGIRLRVNYIRQIYKHGKDPDNWNWKQYDDIVPDYSFLLSKPVSITKNVPHPNCKLTKNRLLKMAQSLSYAKSRKCFVFLCFYHGLDPEETLKRISENPLVPWVACPEPWRELESCPKPPEYPRVKEGYYTPKAHSKYGTDSTQRSSDAKSNNFQKPSKEKSALPQQIPKNDSAVDQLHNCSKDESSETRKAPKFEHELSGNPDANTSSCSQSDPALMMNLDTDLMDSRSEAAMDSAGRVSEFQPASETRVAVKYKSRYKIVYSEDNKAMNRPSSSMSSITQFTSPGSMSRKTSQSQDLNPNPMSQRHSKEPGILNWRSPSIHHLNGWYPLQHMRPYPMAGNNQYPMAGNNHYLNTGINLYSSWNAYQAGGGCSPWNFSQPWFSGGMCNQAGSPWNSAGFCGGGPPGYQPMTRNRQERNFFDSPGFTVYDVCSDPSSDGSHLNAGRFSSVSSAVPPKAAPVEPASVVSVPGCVAGLSTISCPSVSQCDVAFGSEDPSVNIPEQVPLPSGTSSRGFLANWNFEVVTPSQPPHSNKSNNPGAYGEMPGTSSEAENRPPSRGSLPESSQRPFSRPPPSASHPPPPPPLPLSPPSLPPPPPLPSPPSLPPPPPLPSPPPPPSPPPCYSPPPSSEPEEMDWMELMSTEPDHPQGLCIKSSVPNIQQPLSLLKAACPVLEPQKIPVISSKLAIPKFTMLNRKIPKLTIRKLLSSKRHQTPSSSSEVAYKDPAALKPSVESSKPPEIDPKRRNIPVFVEPADYPISRLSDEQITTLENKILDAILDMDKNGVKPVFIESFRRNGRYRVVCSDDFSRKWLYAYLGKHKPWPDSDLRIITKDFNEVRAKAVLPICIDENNEKILKFIDKQNASLDVSKWEVVRRWETGDFKTCMDLVVDEKSAEVLEKRCNIIFKMGTGKITVVKEQNPRVITASEDDIYADISDDKVALQLEKPTEFDSLEHDIYADFYGEKSVDDFSLSRSVEAIYEPNKHTRPDCSRLGSRFIEDNSTRSGERQAWSPPKEEKASKRKWSPKPGGGLCSREDPYVRRGGIVEECQFQARHTRWAPQLPLNRRQDLPGGRTSQVQTDDDELPLKHVCRPRGSPSPCRCQEAELAMEETSYLRSKNSSPRSPIPNRSSSSRSSTDTRRSTTKHSFPIVLSFQTQGFANEQFCPSPPKIERWDDFASASHLLNNLKVKSSDVFGCNLIGVDDNRDKETNSSDDSEDESNFSSISYQLGRTLHDIATNDCKVEDSKPILKDPQDSVRESFSPPISIRGSISTERISRGSQDSNQESNNPAHLIRDATNGDTEDSNPSVDDSHNSEEESSDVLISIECRPGQSLQDVATEQFRKLVAAGYSCQKALQITQAFVSKQLNSSNKPEPPKSPSPPPQSTLHTLATDKFNQLVATGISNGEALAFTRAFIERQMSLPPPADPKPLLVDRDPNFRAGQNLSCPSKIEAGFSNIDASTRWQDDQYQTDDSVDEFVDGLL